MRDQFITKNFHRKSIEMIQQANAIIADYEERGFVLTLRQLYYQFVARQLIENSLHSYKRLIFIMSEARQAGLVDWNSIEDRTRSLRTHLAWDDPADRISSAAANYAEDLWRDQIWRPEVWIEKDALLGVIEGVCDELRVPYFACRGNNSQSEQYKAGKRYAELIEDGRRPIVLHLGDHDPNGLDMTRDNRDRLALFARHPVEVRRLALNYEQVEQYGPPPNPAKETDTRFDGYVAEFGHECWELDALDPEVIADLIRTEVEAMIDRDAWAAALAKEGRNRAALEKLSENWTKVEKSLK
jgi:hypothetical protein